MVVALPDGVDFRKYEVFFPPDEKGRADIVAARKELVRRWAKIDPPAAAIYVMDHPERIHTGTISIAVEQFLKKDLAAAIDRIQDLPPGSHFQSTLGVSVNYLLESYPAEARQLANLMADPKKREEALERIDGHEKERKRRIEAARKRLGKERNG